METTYDSLIWTSAEGKKTSFFELDHQHLSNILWFNEVFNHYSRYNNDPQFLLGLELERRFDGKRLPWKPLPILDEVNDLINMKLITPDGDIIGNRGCGLMEGKIIGSIRHIKQWIDNNKIEIIL